MNTCLKNIIITIFTLSILLSNNVIAFDWFGFAENDEEGIVWKLDSNRYIKITNQDESKYGKNDHPVELNQANLKLALTALVIPDDGFFSSDEETENVFTIQQVQLLSEELPKALEKAGPSQDIIFALESVDTKFLGLIEKKYVTGRIFFNEDKLNILFGEHDFFRSEAFEKEYDPGGQAAVPYNFNLGKRSKASRVFKDTPIRVIGVNNKKINDVIRHDWLVIDVQATANDYLAKKNKRENPLTKYDKQLEKEAAKLAKQRREMRAEMARMRKEVQSVSSNKSSSAKSIEERIGTLDQLLGKKLITQDEYDAKREKILNDI